MMIFITSYVGGNFVHIQRDDIVSVQILIVFGANLKALDSHRRTPLDQVANKSGSVASLLETLLADPGFIHR